MDFNKAFFLKKEEHKPRWVVKNAQGRVLGRLATEIADQLRGKDKPIYTPHSDAGDYVVVINAKDIVLTGNKWEDKIYDRYTGWVGGYKTITAEELMKKHPTRIIELAVKRMLPKNKLGRAMFKKLRIYAGAEHPHRAQIS
ncbi:MAG: 50S ribosomal protein L13 [Candidatus Babeliales bacterium]